MGNYTIICFGKPFEEMQGNLITVDYLESIKSAISNTESP